MIKRRLISLATVLMMLFIPSFFNINENLIYAKEKDILEINKEVKENSNETYNITLNLKGKGVVKEAKKADIVIIIDSSGSMGDDGKIEKVKNSSKKLVKTLLESTNKDKLRIAIADFKHKKTSSYDPGRSSDVKTEFTSDLNKLNESIESISSGGGTDTQDGIWRASNLLESSREEALKYVVFFSDGLPADSETPNLTGYDIHAKNAQIEYYKHFVGYNAPTTVTIGGVAYEPKPEIINVNNNPKYKDVKFYSVGLFTYRSQQERVNAVNFLKTIQNVIEPEKYESKYYTEDIESIEDIFNDISYEIKEEVQNNVVEDSIIQDTVTKEFRVVENSYEITDLNGKEIKLDSNNIQLTKTKYGEDELIFNVGDIIANKKDKSGKLIGGLKVSFDISKRNPYFGGKQIPTNVEANIKYKNPEDKTEHKQIFNIPQVNIPYKTGEITLENELEKEKNDTFSISLFGNSGTKKHKYTVDLKGNKKTTMDFYLRNETTDISNNKDFTKNYFTEGLYDIEEIVPMNYKKYKVMIKDKNNNWVEFKKYINDEKNIEDRIVKDGKLFIGEGNSNIKIKIKNILSNDIYWNDKVHIENKLKYN